MSNSTKRQVLFLCTGNYYRSRFAEELFNHRANLRGLDWKAFSRGLALERGSSNVGPMSTHTHEALIHRRVLPLGADRLPKACKIDDLRCADAIVALAETEHRELLRVRFPGWEARVNYWNIQDVNVSDPVSAVAAIDQEIERFIAGCR
ncbi:low molecular weight phosphatase family protein [Bradyrhizobium sp. 62]|nr:low molecular weight phosphatase family protein [Bradyrhizobium sp. 62]